MKYYGFYNIETGTTDVRAYDPDNDADDPRYGFGDLWNGSGPWDTYAEAEAAANDGAATLRRLVIRKAGTSPAETENYAIIRCGDPVPEGWFIKAEFDTAAEADRFIGDSVAWCRWNGIGWDHAEKDDVVPTSDVGNEDDDELLSDLLLRKLTGK